MAAVAPLPTPAPAWLSTALDAVDAALDTLATVDPDTLDSARLEDTLAAVHRQTQRLAAWRSRSLASYDRRRPKTTAGPAPVEQLTGGVLRQGRREAGRAVRTARQLQGLPAVQAAFDDGRISQAHADVLADTLADDTVRALPGAVRTLLEVAERTSPDLLRLRARKLATAADPHGTADRHRRAKAGRFLRSAPPDRDGTVDITVRSDQTSAEIIHTQASGFAGR